MTNPENTATHPTLRAGMDPLETFAHEVAMGAYSPSELRDRARAAMAMAAGIALVNSATQPSPLVLKFPTMLRKMWSGGEVQTWLDERGPLFSSPPVSGCPRQLPPLTEDEKHEAWAKGDRQSRDAFYDGIDFAERHHGVQRADKPADSLSLALKDRP